MEMRQDGLHRKFYDENKPLIYKCIKEMRKLKQSKITYGVKKEKFFFETELTDERQLFKKRLGRVS